MTKRNKIVYWIATTWLAGIRDGINRISTVI